MRGTYLFDLDMTLVNTESIKPHRGTDEGKSFIADHPEKCGTILIDDYLLKLVNRLHNQYGNVAVVTNSPLRCARSVLSYHGFSPNIPVYGGLSKPAPGGIESVLRELDVNAKDALIIGDSPGDILAGHNCNVVGVGVIWGEFPENKIERAEPADLIEVPIELDDIINRFERGEYCYKPRKSPLDYVVLDRSFWKDEVSVSITGVMDYYPT